MLRTEESLVPPDLRAVVIEHGRAVAAGDQAAVLADFRADRVGQLASSAALPPGALVSEVLGIEAQPDGPFAAHIRYRAAGGGEAVLRSRWRQMPEGWRVTDVRNVPDTPPRLSVEGPLLSGVDAPHWAGLQEGQLLLQRCRDCARWIWAPRPICPSCHGFGLDWAPVEPAGTVYAWTRTWQAFAPEVRGHLPYVVVLVELPAAGGSRVLGVLEEGDGADVRIGQDVVGSFDPPEVPDGRPLLRWRIA